jgi:hypothetical protein
LAREIAHCGGKRLKKINLERSFTVWFHCQQTEDTIKFILPGPIPRIMDLLELCVTRDSSFNVELGDADTLTDYVVAIRYPDVRLELNLG